MKNGARGRRRLLSGRSRPGRSAYIAFFMALMSALPLVFVSLGLLLASRSLASPLLVVALFLRDFVGGLHLLLGHLACVAVAGLVLLLQFGLGHVFLALGFLLADVLGVVLHGVALGLGDLVVGLDLFLGDLVFVTGHRAGLRGHEAGGSESQHEQVFFHWSFPSRLLSAELELGSR
jgi:hypothetical protein